MHVIINTVFIHVPDECKIHHIRISVRMSTAVYNWTLFTTKYEKNLNEENWRIKSLQPYNLEEIMIDKILKDSCNIIHYSRMKVVRWLAQWRHTLKTAKTWVISSHSTVTMLNYTCFYNIIWISQFRRNTCMYIYIYRS